MTAFKLCVLLCLLVLSYWWVHIRPARRREFVRETENFPVLSRIMGTRRRDWWVEKFAKMVGPFRIIGKLPYIHHGHRHRRVAA